MNVLIPSIVFAWVAVGHQATEAPALFSMDSAVQLAFRNREIVNAAKQRLRQAIGQKQTLGAFPATRLEAGSGTRPDVPGGEEFLVAQPLDLFNKTSGTRASGSSLVELAQAGLRQAELDVQSQVILAYADEVAAERYLATAQQLADIALQIDTATQKRVEVGTLPPAQKLRSALEVSRANQVLAVRKFSQQSAKIRLLSAIGIDSLPTSSIQEIPMLTAGLAPSKSNVSTRPDIQSSLADVHAAQAERKSGSLSWLPDFELQFRRTPFAEQERYGLRVQMVWPFFDHGASHGRRTAADAQLKAAELTLKDRSKRALAEIKSFGGDLLAADLAVRSFGDLKRSSIDLLDKTRRAYDLGGATLLDVLDASRAVQSIEEGEIDAIQRRSQAIAALFAATGTILNPTPSFK